MEQVSNARNFFFVLPGNAFSTRIPLLINFLLKKILNWLSRYFSSKKIRYSLEFHLIWTRIFQLFLEEFFKRGCCQWQQLVGNSSILKDKNFFELFLILNFLTWENLCKLLHINYKITCKNIKINYKKQHLVHLC